MNAPRFEKQTNTSKSKGRSARRTKTQRAADPADMYLESIGRSVAVCDALNDPSVSVLLAEDLYWRTSVADWRRRRPAWFRFSEYRGWQAEKRELDDKRARIRAIAGDLKLLSS